MTAFTLVFILFNPQISPESAVSLPGSSGFSHALHLKTQPDCKACHSETINAIRVSDHRAPTHAQCTQCHQQDLLPVNQKCDRCHQSPVTDPPSKSRALPGLKFSHRLHQDKQIPCVTCHGDVSTANPVAPTMSTCTDCHGETNVARGCDKCHQVQGDGRLQTHFAQFQLKPNRDALWEIAHDDAFEHKHGKAAQRDLTLCQECHSPSTCLTCHQTSRRVGIHPGDYLRHHSVEARHDEARCQSCHQPSTFCLDCHARAGVTIAPGPRQFGKLSGQSRIHPPGFVGRPGEPRSTNHHGFAARTNLSSCVSCHQENDCVRCHSTRTPSSLRASPHPPGFECGRALDVSVGGCLKCHTSQETLQRLCRTRGLE